ncbi:unnamed protein product [Fraxinus pennsylvanica]|uniref:GDSL esterase/lipase n=1 Tax=Fraxinus pennsylvanica TaxID=56036 RepID=A0AAD2A4V0_9LAMI|nr:unnamed protein product [Fraxinus pennsylvanica]
MSSSICFTGLAISLVGFMAIVAPPVEGARAFFVFGDSLVDNGNNNYLATTARADSPPYGIDYPTHRPTGRFSNGFNIPDLISQKLGAESALPYLSPQFTGEKLLVGANFASAGIGILNDTGIQFANIIRIYPQLEFFRQYQQRVAALIGEEKAQQLVNKALVLITLGGNDFVNNYFFTPITARRLQSTNGQCAEEPQRAAAIFNPLLIQMIRSLNQELGSDIFIAANAVQMQNNFIDNPRAFGFVTAKIACCGQGPYNGVGICNPTSNLCPNREVYAFWDPFHPTERANKIIVSTIFTGSDEYMTPMNLSTIMQLDSMT